AADWDRQVRQLYEARYAGTAPRPARTLAEQQKTAPAAVQNNTILQQTGIALAPARQAEQAAGVKVEQVAREQRERFQAAAKQRPPLPVHPPEQHRPPPPTPAPPKKDDKGKGQEKGKGNEKGEQKKDGG